METVTLHEYFLKSTGISTDTRNLSPDNLFFALKGDNFNGNKFALQALENGASYAIVDEPGLKKHPKVILVKNCLETLQHLAAFHRKYLNLPVIALTGSNGKTTTKELMQAVLSKKYKVGATRGNLNNHIGVPLTLLSMDSTTEMGLIEMGANHQGEIAKLCEIVQPDFGYITNFGKAHLEGFGGFQGVIKGKSELYQSLVVRNKPIFINQDDPLQVKQAKTDNTISFSEGSEADYQITFLSAHPYVKVAAKGFEIQSHLLGAHHAKNIAAAICTGLYFGVSPKKIKEGIEAYVPENNRSQVLKKGGNEFILDAYNANPTSMKAALENFLHYPSPKKIVILGDMLEIGITSTEEHQYIIDFLENSSFDKMLVCGAEFFKTKTNTVQKFKTFEHLKNHLQKLSFSRATILIKASRGMALERLVDEI